MEVINEDQDNDTASKHKVNQKRNRWTEFSPQKDKQNSGQQFYGWVHRRDACLATRTTSQQEDIAQDRDVVIPTDRRSTIRTS